MGNEEIPLSHLIFAMLIINALAIVSFNVKPSKGTWTGTVYIRADGSIDPPDAPITTYDNITYTLTGNVTSSGDGIVVERDNIILDGAGYTIQGTGEYPYKGVVLSGRNNVTIKNTTITTFYDGVYLYYSSNIVISGNNITNNWDGVYLPSSSNNAISGNNITNNGYRGVYLEYSSNNAISANNITANELFGVGLWYSSNNSISGNSITNNIWGVYLWNSSSNVISGNTIVLNVDGIDLRYSSNNMFYHNNFINNAVQVYVFGAGANVWDNGYPSGGNYWSDYVGVDVNSDGIGDSPYIIDENNVDRFPLMAPFASFDAGEWDGTRYSVGVFSNSTVSGFMFDVHRKSIIFNVTGEDGTKGFCRVSIPKGLLWVEDGWTILIDGQQITDYKMYQDENNTYLYFTYNHSTKTVTIQGTHVIPEFPSTILTLTILILATIITIIWKAKRSHQPTHFSISHR